MCGKIRRGDIYFADLTPTVGSEQGGVRPVLIIQNDTGNEYSPTIIAVAITSKFKMKLPTHIELRANIKGLPKNSLILCEQIKTLDKTRLKNYITHIDESKMTKVNNAIAISLGMRNSKVA